MSVLLCNEIEYKELERLLAKFNISIALVDQNKEIPGSWFGDSEAGLVKNQLHIRMDTPVHSALHEAGHFICMDENRRQALHTNAGGDYDEENAVCYLQILLAEYINGFGRERAYKDMDEWGYTFRLGSSQAWFENDAEDAFDWLVEQNIIDNRNNILWRGNQARTALYGSRTIL